MLQNPVTFVEAKDAEVRRIHPQQSSIYGIKPKPSHSQDPQHMCMSYEKDILTLKDLRFYGSYCPIDTLSHLLQRFTRSDAYLHMLTARERFFPISLWQFHHSSRPIRPYIPVTAQLLAKILTALALGMAIIPLHYFRHRERLIEAGLLRSLQGTLKRARIDAILFESMRERLPKTGTSLSGLKHSLFS